MPSIAEVDNIKSLDDSGQTSILTKTGTGGSKVFTLDNVTLGSSAVFPAGHVLQTVVDTDTGTHRTYNGAWQDWIGLEVELTTKKLNSKFLIQLVSGMAGYYNGHWAVDFRRIVTDGADTEQIATAAYSTTANYGIGKQDSADADWGMAAFLYVDAPTLAKGTVVTYRPQAYAVASTYFMHAGALATMVIQEIAV